MKKSIILIITIITVFLIVGGIIFMISKKDSSDNKTADNNNTNNIGTDENKADKKNPSDKIKEIVITQYEILALTDKGDLYAIGNNSYGEFGLGNSDEIDYTAKIASDVKKFWTGNYGILYTDSNDDLFHAGLNYKSGGSSETFEKASSNVKDIYSDLVGMIIIDNDGKIEFTRNHFCDKHYSEAVIDTESENNLKSLTNIKYFVLGTKYNGYVNNDGELYIKTSNDNDYVKILDNVDKYIPRISEDSLGQGFLTKENILYYYDGSLNQVDMNVVDAGKNYYKTNDGKYYVLNERYAIDQLVKVEGRTDVELLNIEDVKELLYISVYYGEICYINTDNKLVMINQDEEKIVDYNVQSIDEIYDFICF